MSRLIVKISPNSDQKIILHDIFSWAELILTLIREQKFSFSISDISTFITKKQINPKKPLLIYEIINIIKPLALKWKKETPIQPYIEFSEQCSIENSKFFIPILNNI